ncbi:MAG TPA: hypothetical protein G4O02_08755 [Caldilineae bacterium]|nr:hypothetical protein [Caldilineae bacterium]
MARSRARRRGRGKARSRAAKGERLPLVAFISLMAGFLLTYLGAEMVLSTYLHPVHWLTAGGGGLLGYLAGMGWYRWRGDIV